MTEVEIQKVLGWEHCNRKSGISRAEFIEALTRLDAMFDWPVSRITGEQCARVLPALFPEMMRVLGASDYDEARAKFLKVLGIQERTQ